MADKPFDELANFLDLVKRMRAAQVAYFRERSTPNLATAKQLERTVDVMIADLEKKGNRLL